MSETKEVVPLRWWSTFNGTVGAVALIDRQFGYWKAYIGIVLLPREEQSDAEFIAYRGTHLGEDVARVLIADAGVDVEGLEYKGA